MSNLNIIELAKEITGVNVGDLGPTPNQENYVYTTAHKLANLILQAEMENVRLRVLLPPNLNYTYFYVTVRGAYNIYKGDSETDEPSELTVYPLSGMVKIEFETDEVEIKEYHPHPGFDGIPF